MSVHPLLQVDRLSVRYPGQRKRLIGPRTSTEVVKSASFTIARSETFGLIGESGSGKSTIGRSILRLLKPASGSIIFDGQRIEEFGRRTPLEYRRRVQCVYQDPLSSLNPRHLIGDAIGEAVHRHWPIRGASLSRRVVELMADVGLASHHAPKFPHELSGGQQQRVAIARALATEPDLIVCDEAVSALDVSTQSQVINLLEDVQAERGISYLFITHDMSVVRHISSRLAIIQHGELVETGLTEDVFNNPQTEYTRSLLTAVPTLGAPDGE